MRPSWRNWKESKPSERLRLLKKRWATFELYTVTYKKLWGQDVIAILLFSSTGFQRGRHCLETDLSELQSRGKICDTLPNKNALCFYDALKKFWTIKYECTQNWSRLLLPTFVSHKDSWLLILITGISPLHEYVYCTLCFTQQDEEDLLGEEKEQTSQEEGPGDPDALRGSRGAQYGGECELLYSQFELHSPIAKKHQMELLQVSGPLAWLLHHEKVIFMHSR